MEFRIERGALAEAVAWAARSLPARSPVPVLGGLLLTAGEGRLALSGFDYEASAYIEVAADTGRAGQALVLGRRLLDICKVLPESTLTCATEGARFTVEGGGTRFGLSTLPVGEYPALPALPAPRGTVDAARFAEAVAQVAIAAGRDEALPVLTGIQLRLDGASMTLAASDRYRYAVRTLPWQPDTADPQAVEVVVPGRRLTELARSLAKTGTVRIGLNGPAEHGGSGAGLIAFEGVRMRTTLRLLDGRLPRYGKLFALENPAVAVTGREALADAVRRVAVVAEPNSPVRLDFRADGTVLLQAGYEDDVASQRLPATLADADELSVAFNPAYLLDALASFRSPRVRFELLGAGQRSLLSGAPDAEAEEAPAPQDHRHLLMSVRQLS
ncbi:DNA polymerase III subunit beta [Streptomyces sp. NBC_00083]|uniref:DNA polymerase III subunit beta n=1 Tax=Streptomyces sp. NBC_00083 TaxID=2975647 RepID=UPI002256EDC8|nr:DNA polymerase III subunit beta [Streptomyces sp. NBC_00083]MCX5385205.1 DNA polymerase III subunit beta [Streptomyces sp. NBC_00083]